MKPPWGLIGSGENQDVDRDGFGVGIVRTPPHIAAVGVSVGVVGVVVGVCVGVVVGLVVGVEVGVGRGGGRGGRVILLYTWTLVSTLAAAVAMAGCNSILLASSE